MPPEPMNCDVLVVGGGHAGCEAALAAARLGARTLLVTLSSESLARLSCNPAIGGLAKSHLVFELDALGGEMGRNADSTGIQFRVLNTRKGPAVQSNRIQCDKDRYPRRMRRVIEEEAGIKLVEASARRLLRKGDRILGIETNDGRILRCRTLVLACGTFLGGMIHIGMKQIPSGRFGECAETEISGNLEAFGHRAERLKTGTPPRLHKDSLDYREMDLQPGEAPAPCVSMEGRAKVRRQGAHAAELFHVEQWDRELAPWPAGCGQIPCFLTKTTERTHEIVASNLRASALYGGAIKGTGVRYCPSIEDKVVKFPSRTSHHVFVEPEGRDSARIYPNGISNSLPEEIQVELVRSIPGMGRAEMIRPGYAIEYDFFDPRDLDHRLASRKIEGLYIAGQLNGTTGYEEAAVQGFVAGVNASAAATGSPELLLSRWNSYIGVLLDDLVIKGTNEPYRMFTSRAEHRLLLRQGNAFLRMLSFARTLQILPREYIKDMEVRASQVESELARLSEERIGGETLAKRLCRPGMGYRSLPGARPDLAEETVEEIETAARYDGYIRIERNRLKRMEGMDGIPVPEGMDYAAIRALKRESVEKLSRVRPRTLGQAARISGVTPADISVLAVRLAKRRA